MTPSEGPTSQPATPQPTADEPISFDVDLGTALIELAREECLELLAAKSVGRLAYAAHYGARILPVNYVLADDSIIFRTLPNGAIFHHALNSMCAFEVDDTDEFFESGWSVVATGFLELATRDDFEHMRHGKLRNPGPQATDARSYGCPAHSYRGGESSATVGEQVIPYTGACRQGRHSCSWEGQSSMR